MGYFVIKRPTGNQSLRLVFASNNTNDNTDTCHLTSFVTCQSWKFFQKSWKNGIFWKNFKNVIWKPGSSYNFRAIKRSHHAGMEFTFLLLLTNEIFIWKKKLTIFINSLLIRSNAIFFLFRTIFTDSERHLVTIADIVFRLIW